MKMRTWMLIVKVLVGFRFVLAVEFVVAGGKMVIVVSYGASGGGVRRKWGMRRVSAGMRISGDIDAVMKVLLLFLLQTMRQPVF